MNKSEAIYKQKQLIADLISCECFGVDEETDISDYDKSISEISSIIDYYIASGNQAEVAEWRKMLQQTKVEKRHAKKMIEKNRMDIPLFERWGYKVQILHSNKTYMDAFNHIITRGERKGKKVGFPMAGKCVINRDCKIKPIKDFFKNVDYEYLQYIGIAVDEPTRLARVVQTQNQTSLLQKYGYTEQMAFDLCKKYDLLSPIYDFSPRGGCWFCPNARDWELRHLRNNHSELWNKLLAMEEMTDLVGDKWNILTQKSIHDKEEQFFWEDNQMTIFDFME